MLAENHPSNLIQEYIKNQVNKLRRGSDASVSTDSIDNKSPSNINDKFTQLNLNNNSIFNLTSTNESNASSDNVQKQINIPKPIKKSFQLNTQYQKLQQTYQDEENNNLLKEENYQQLILQQLSKTFMSFEDLSQQQQIPLQKNLELLTALQLQNKSMKNQEEDSTISFIQQQQQQFKTQSPVQISQQRSQQYETQQQQSFESQLKLITNNFMNLEDFQNQQQAQNSSSLQLLSEIQQQMSKSTPHNLINLSSLVNTQLCNSLPVIQEQVNYNKILNNLLYIPFGLQFQNTNQLKTLQENLNNNNNIKNNQQNNGNVVSKQQQQYIGPLTVAERKEKVERYQQKKRNRSWKLIKYKIRQKLADQRERFQGRFIKQQKPKFYEVINNMIKEKQQQQQQQQQITQQNYNKNMNQSEMESNQKSTDALQNSFQQNDLNFNENKKNQN